MFLKRFCFLSFHKTLSPLPRRALFAHLLRVYLVTLTHQSTRKIKTMAPQHQTSQKTYHTEATGTAALTALNHKDDCDLKLFGSCFW